MPHRDDDLNDPILRQRRQDAADEEAAALRREVVRWVRSGEAGQEASGALRELFREGLEEAVRDTLADGEVARQLADEMRRELTGALAEEIRQEVRDQVRAAVQDELFSQEQLADLRQEVGAAAIAAATARATEPERSGPSRAALSGRRDGRRPRNRNAQGSGTARRSGTAPSSGHGGSDAAPPVADRESNAPHPAQRSAYGRRPPFAGLDWSQPGVLAGLITTIVVLAAALWFFFLRPDTPSGGPTGTEGTVEQAAPNSEAAPPGNGDTGTNGVADNTVNSPGGSTSLALPPGSLAGPLVATWDASVANAAPVPEGLTTPPRQRFGCWFSGAVPDDLAGATLEAEEAAGSGSLELRLRNTFPECVGRDAVSDNVNAAVYAAQAAAHAALERRASADWAGCRTLPTATATALDLTGFRADGRRGPGTYALLDALATCRGVATALNFDAGSDVTDYLFALYLALRDLEGNR